MISDRGDFWTAFNNLRSLLPFAAGIIAFVVVVIRISKKRATGWELASPLGFIFMYGVVGLVAAVVSPDINTALWWSGLYLMVPIVLWGISGNAEAEETIKNILNITWIVITLFALVLVVIASYYLDFDSVVRNPSLLAECKSGNWYDLTSGSLRDTGVGRYAAIAALISLSLMFRKRLWILGLMIFVLTSALLLFTGARGAIAGFFVASPLMLLLYLGRKAIWMGIPLLVAGLILLWVTGLHNVFYERCILSAQSGFWPVRVVEGLVHEGTNINLMERTSNQRADQHDESLDLVTNRTNIKKNGGLTSINDSARSLDAYIESNLPMTDEPSVETADETLQGMELMSRSILDASPPVNEHKDSNGDLGSETRSANLTEQLVVTVDTLDAISPEA